MIMYVFIITFVLATYNLYYYYEFHVIQVMDAYAKMLGLQRQHSLEFDNQKVCIKSVHMFRILSKLDENREDTINLSNYKV